MPEENPVSTAAAPEKPLPSETRKGPGRPRKTAEESRLDKLERTAAEQETKIGTLFDWFDDLLPQAFRSKAKPTDKAKPAEKSLFDEIFGE